MLRHESKDTGASVVWWYSRWRSGLRLTASRGSTPPGSRARVGRGTQSKPQMQRPGHTGRKALAKKKRHESKDMDPERSLRYIWMLIYESGDMDLAEDPEI